jgi:hypothetical protein
MVVSYRILRDDVAATMTPEDAAAYDEELLAATIAHAYGTAAELAVFKPMLAARLLTAYLAAEQPGQEDESDRAWHRLQDAWMRASVSPCIVWQEVAP